MDLSYQDNFQGPDRQFLPQVDPVREIEANGNHELLLDTNEDGTGETQMHENNTIPTRSDFSATNDQFSDFQTGTSESETASRLDTFDNNPLIQHEHEINQGHYVQGGGALFRS